MKQNLPKNLNPVNNSVFEKIIEALEIKLHKVNLRKVINPVQLDGSYENKNFLVQLRKGTLLATEKYNPLQEGGFYFVPSMQPVYAKFGKSQSYSAYGAEGFQAAKEREKFIQPTSFFDVEEGEDSFVVIRFDAMIYNAISLFTILELQGVTIPPNAEMNEMIEKMLEEEEQNNVGKAKMLETLTEQLIIHLFRHISKDNSFAKLIEKMDYLLDKRLINIIKYIQENLEKDLSNKAIAKVAYVSEDYVGQFFKSLTGINLQDYVETQRLEKAHFLLRTRSDIVQEIAFHVGFKDPAYFSRRFKMKYGINANVVRRKDSFAI